MTWRSPSPAQVTSFGADSEPGLIFTNEWGRPTRQFPFAMTFANALRRAGLCDSPTAHDLPHFYASALIRSGLHHGRPNASVIAQRRGPAAARPLRFVEGIAP